jgi:predicted Zn-dependent protease
VNNEVKKVFAEAVRLKKQGELLAAKEMLVSLAASSPHSVAVFAVLGDVYMEMGLLGEAISAFRSAVRLAPKLEGVSLALFHCLWKLNRRDEALEEVKRFMSVSDSVDYREIINELNQKCGNPS